MTDEMKILLALQQLENVMKLVKGNQWEIFFSRNLIPVRIELHRQLTCLQDSAKIKE
tara:strand:- start:165 stop:335 length:171 start_codon:yes stop_codon:yes gene_type:complete